MTDYKEQTSENPGIHSGFVSVMGRPNVGKSTLINALMGQKIAAVSPRPQTTRQQQLGILTTDDAQIIFIDTPGLHNPHHKLGRYMNQEAAATLEDGDVILFLVEASQNPPHEEDHILVELLGEVKNPPPVILALNKIDRLKIDEIDERIAIYQDLLPSAQVLPLSATSGQGLDVLLETLKGLLPEGDYFYPEDQITDLYEKEIAADLVREAALLHLREEVPHAMAVRIDEFTERGDHGAYIGATLFVERDSQKGIVIGKEGKMLKRIGSTARQEIEKMSGRKVFLKLRIKVRKNWRNDENSLRRFGFQSK
jgi:GTP-binding protein Era